MITRRKVLFSLPFFSFFAGSKADAGSVGLISGETKGSQSEWVPIRMFRVHRIVSESGIGWSDCYWGESFVRGVELPCDYTYTIDNPDPDRVFTLRGNRKFSIEDVLNEFNSQLVDSDDFEFRIDPVTNAVTPMRLMVKA